MPKTHTDDIDASFPSVMEGPVGIVDPADHNSQLVIDPASAGITAIGAARPLRHIDVGFNRNMGAGMITTMGVAIAGRLITPGSDAGFWANVFAVSGDMDTGAPSSVFVPIAAGANSLLSGAAVRLEVTATRAANGAQASDLITAGYDHLVPDNWQEDAVEIVRVDVGNGYTFGPDSFELGDVVGLCIVLARTAEADTFDQAVKIAAGAVFEYTARQI